MAAKNKTFREFLRGYLEKDSPLGDLARDSFYNCFWQDSTIDSLKKHMKNFQACDEAWKALDEAIVLYESKGIKFTRKTKPISLRYLGRKDGSLDPEGIEYVIKAFRSYGIEITAEEGLFKGNTNSAEQEWLVHSLCADLNLG